MKKPLCALLLLILLPFGTVQSAEFKLTGRTTWQLGQLMVNGIPFAIDGQTRFKDGLSEDDLGGCLLYTSPSPRDATLSRMPSSA